VVVAARPTRAVTGPSTPAANPLVRGNASGRATRELLILTAERLFADRGIDAVSLREIGQVAGQRNNAAAQYHFGTRAELLKAIYLYRAASINARRLDLLAELRRQERLGDLHALLKVLLTPHVESISDADNHFLGFLARLLTDRATLSNMTPEPIAPFLGGYNQLLRFMRACIPELSDADFDRRSTAVFNWAIHTLAEYSRTTSAGGLILPVESMFEELVTMLAAALAADPTPRLRRVRARRGT
jgi:AcrR family transcriptional regulator